MPETDLQLESRRDIYQEVRRAPGTHFRGLLRELDYAKGTVQYHLRWLVARGLVESESDGEYTRYYPAREFEPADKATLSALRRTYSREVLAHLAADGPLTTTDLAERLGKSASTVSWHLSRLHDAGLVAKRRDGRSVEYTLADRERVATLYATYEESFTDRLLDNLVDVWNA
ncbi:MAG: winged helix-turn-helix transcriptional regulator [Halobacteriaceae archaeon]